MTPKPTSTATAAMTTTAVKVAQSAVMADLLRALQDIESDHVLELLGFFVTSEDPILSRRLEAGGYALLVHLPQALSLNTLERLAACKNRGRLIEQALAVQACAALPIGQTPTGESPE
jgi:hypothetical protein